MARSLTGTVIRLQSLHHTAASNAQLSSTNTHTLTSVKLFLIIFDSLASLNAISHPTPPYPLVTRIQILLETCSSASIAIIFIWDPGHIGMPGNEKVDKAVKQAIYQPTVSKSVLP